MSGDRQQSAVDAAERWIASKSGAGGPTPVKLNLGGGGGSSGSGGSGDLRSSKEGGHRARAPKSPAKNKMTPHSHSPGVSGSSGEINHDGRGGFENYTPHGPGGAGGSPDKFFARGNETLYEAYNQLHTLAQEFDKPFDAPAILVVGQQTDGKSALVEGLMGFQFNHVGGGTKTRRPITINMKYNMSCTEPVCYLSRDDTLWEEELSLHDLREYIEAENHRLEQDSEQFWAKEIVVKIEYKYCPNLTIIDTPGLISAPSKGRTSPLQGQAKAVEILVKQKMENRDYIILCLEDTSDWSNATTRNLVLEVDPDLRRTVVVSTKFDTRLPQFSRGEDVERFLRPPARLLDTAILGGSPFFTSVPSGRVGHTRECVFRSDEHFRATVWEREEHDVKEMERIMGRKLDSMERQRVGVSQLRRFLEKLLRRRYLENVPSIVPVLEREYRNAQEKLQQTVQELSDLDTDKLKERGRSFYATFVSKIPLLLRGTMAAPVERFGETLADEHIRGGAFVASDGRPVVAPVSYMPNADMRLLGGAQWTRALAEFRQVLSDLCCPVVNKEEIVNSCGVDEMHDGINYTRTACIIAVAKAKEVFEPFLHQLGYRMMHIMRRLLQMAMYLMRKDGQFLNGHELFLKRVGSCYYSFVEENMRACLSKCLEDLESTTEFVSWSLHTNGRPGLRNILNSIPNTQQTPPAIAPSPANRPGSGVSAGGVVLRTPTPAMASVMEAEQPTGPQAQLTMLVENSLWNRSLASVTEDIVQTLVMQVFEGIRDHIITQAELKFNCFFLMPIIHKFPNRLRETLEQAFEDDLDNVFDVAAVRAALENRRGRLEKELHQVELIQEKFTVIHHHLTSPTLNQSLRKGADGAGSGDHKHGGYAQGPLGKESNKENSGNAGYDKWSGGVDHKQPSRYGMGSQQGMRL